MVKEYIRKCDNCKNEIKNLYDFGVTTLYKNIRIGRGGMFKDYDEGSIYNLMNNESPNDYDSYGKGWRRDEDAEFSFCCPECLGKFLIKLYENSYSESMKQIREKKETLNQTVKEFDKKYGDKIPFFRKIQTKFSKAGFMVQAKKELKELKEYIKWTKKRLKLDANAVIDDTEKKR